MKKATVIKLRPLYLFFNSLKTQIYNGECRAVLKAFKFGGSKNKKVLKVATVLLFISFLLLAVSSCKKYSKELTTVNFHLYNPVTNEGFANVKVKIIQQEDVTGAFQVESKYESTVIWEGVTDAEGKATYSFNAMKKDKFEYWHSVDEGFKVGKNLIQQPEFKPINKNEISEITYKISYYINLKNWIKNINCYDLNDKMKFRKRSIIDSYDNWSSWTPNGPISYYEGCMDYFTNSYTHTGYLGCRDGSN